MYIFSLQETARLKKSQITSIYRNILTYPIMYNKMITQKETIRDTKTEKAGQNKRKEKDRDQKRE
jgi:hypothetical protein